jgi:hypothetical protein
MAKTKGGSISQNKKVSFGRKRKRPGVISKKKNSTSKRSKNYRKKYKGQGR